MKKIKEYFYETKLILRSVPALVVTAFVVSVVLMNLMANKVFFRANDIVAADCGIFLSWIPFLSMDIITKRFGPKAAIRINILAVIINLLCVGLFEIVCYLPGDGNDYSAFNMTFKGTWFILLGSMLAMLIAGIVNSILNYSIGKMFKKHPDGKLAYVSRTYISTFIGQFVDNFVFALVVYVIFGPIYWEGFEAFSILLCVGCGVFGALLELLMEVIFSPIGYKIIVDWKRDNVGAMYLEYEAQKQSERENLSVEERL